MLLLTPFQLWVMHFLVFCHAKPNHLLLVSMDGLRWDYLSKTNMPNIKRLITQGAHATKLKGVFPSVTFPNHWSIVTGKTVEKHGVVANSFYDPGLGRAFGMSDTDEVWWNATEPIWVTAAKQNLTAATYFWPGSEAEINGIRPRHWKKFSFTEPPMVQIDTVVGWLRNESVDMATIHFPEPDLTGHYKGPEAPETFAKIEEMDGYIGYLMTKLEASNLENKVNLILLSDHGMVEVDSSRTIPITRWIELSDLVWIADGPVGQIVPKPGLEQKVYRALKNAHPNMSVYLRDDVPERFHYRSNVRVPTIIAIADEGWYIESNTSLDMKGDHGYDNSLDSMKTMLIARGPDFRVGHTVPELQSLDVYPLMCHLLNIVPEAHDGSFERISCLLKDSGHCVVSRAASLASTFWLSLLLVNAAVVLSLMSRKPMLL